VTLPPEAGVARIVRLDVFTTEAAVLVKLTADGGLTGWAGVGSGPGSASTETPAGVASVVRHVLAPLVLGRPLAARGALLVAFDRAGSPGAATAALDVALHDLVARAAGVPLYRWLGGGHRAGVEAAARVLAVEPEAAGREAGAWVSRGVRVLVVRVGIGSRDRDVARLRAIREAAGEGVRLALDAASAWTVREAIARIRALEPYGPESVEEPVAADDVLGAAEVARAVGVPVVAGTLRSLADAMTRVRLGAAGMLRVTPTRVGGLHRARRLAALADAVRLPHVVGQPGDTMLATVAAAHLALATAPRWAELGGAAGPADDPDAARVHEAGRIVVPSGPGLGAAPDEGRLERAATLTA
jgi:muconate cycloisomerase